MHNWHTMIFLAVRILPVAFTAMKLSINSGTFGIKTRKRLCIFHNKMQHMRMHNEEREKLYNECREEEERTTSKSVLF